MGFLDADGYATSCADCAGDFGVVKGCDLGRIGRQEKEGLWQGEKRPVSLIRYPQSLYLRGCDGRS